MNPPMQRCRCRAGCLAVVTPDDDYIALTAGAALTSHVDPALIYPTEPLFELSEVLS